MKNRKKDPPRLSLDANEGAALLDETAQTIQRHVVLRPEQAYVITLWIGATHLIGVIDVMALLLITSPTMRCGKTVLLQLLSVLVREGLMVSHGRSAELIRLIHDLHPTILVDDLRSDDVGMRGLINASEYRDSLVVDWGTHATFAPTQIQRVGACAVAMTGLPHPKTVDRSLVISLHRRAPCESVEPMRLDTLCETHRSTRLDWKSLELKLGVAIGEAVHNLVPLTNVCKESKSSPRLNCVESATCESQQ